MILHGHPTGAPHSHNAAQAYWEHSLLHSFATAWFPSRFQLNILSSVPGMRNYADRFSRRRYEPIAKARITQNVFSEAPRLIKRILCPKAGDRIAHEANEWLMRAFCRELENKEIQAIHSYVDCAMLPFRKARGMGIKTIYDSPTAYAPAWKSICSALEERYADWKPDQQNLQMDSATLDQKIEEMSLADLVLAPSQFVRQTIDPDIRSKVKVVPYGTELSPIEVAHPCEGCGSFSSCNPFRFLFVGSVSLLKGVPTLIDAWERGAFARMDCELWIAGSWGLHPDKLAGLPSGIRYRGVLSRQQLQEVYQQCHVLVFPSNFDGFGLVIPEALGMGLPVITTYQTAGPDLLDDKCGTLFQAGDQQALESAMLYFYHHRADWPEMSRAARSCVATHEWGTYRMNLVNVVRQLF